MPRLTLSLLGSPQIALDGQPVTGFKSDKVRALLVYLTVESDRPHRREALAGLLWPDMPNRPARSNLRDVLSNLRKVIGDRDATPPFLNITRETIQFNIASDYWLDVAEFRAFVSPDQSDVSALRGLEGGVALYRGGFLEGFSLSDSAAFEEWALLTQERLARQMSSALHRLAAENEQRGAYEKAQANARWQVELEPWDEAAHQQLIRTLALSGQRSAALAQYEACRRLLGEELGVEPAEETTRLYEQVRTGTLKAPKREIACAPVGAAGPPPFVDEAAGVESERPIFVARERELAQLDNFLDLTLAGKGRVVFVTGEAGSGKTALLQEFTQRALETHSTLVVATGNCSAHTGAGDPYLSLREVLALLTGEVQVRWAAGAVTREHASRLWLMLPCATQALVETGPDLIDTFVVGPALLERAETFTSWAGGADWSTELAELVERKALYLAQETAIGPRGINPQQKDLFEQYTRVIRKIAFQAPLVLMVDDLQWADAGTINLLFHMGRQLAGTRVLVVGAYRPEEVALGRPDPPKSFSPQPRVAAERTGSRERHPLEPVVNELQRLYGDSPVNVDQADRRDFTDALLSSESHRLGPQFREMLFRRTRGHPLFTVELLRGMQERGDVVRDPEGWWIEGPALDWDTLPARVEAAIAERIGRLGEPLQAVLRVASVEGEDFTAEVIARVLGINERDLVGRLSSELDRRHRLVRAQTIERLGTQRVSRYRFRHFLCQKYLYDSLDTVERAYLHEDVGKTLESLYGEHTIQIAFIAPQLARHFQEAGISEKAIHYLHVAGERAVQLSAYPEAIAHLTRGLEMLAVLPDSDEIGGQRKTEFGLQRERQELAFQLALGAAWIGTKGTASGEFHRAYARSRELCEQLGESSQLSRVLGELSISHYVQAEHRRARELGEEALSLAQGIQDPLLVALGHWYVGIVLFALGEYATARAHLEEVVAFYGPERHHRTLVYLRGSDSGLSAMAYVALCTWCLGYPEQALKKAEEALALARELGHPFTLADVLAYAGCLLSAMRRDADALAVYAEELIQISTEQVPAWLGTAICYRGEAAVIMGQFQQGTAQMREGMPSRDSIGVRCYLSGTLRALATGYAIAGQPENGLAALTEAFEMAEESDERHWEAELYRLRADLLLMQGDDSDAAASYQEAINVARRQQAKSWELRATTSLARLWHKQGRTEEVRQVLAEIYGWFDEGLDTPDLQEARALLDTLA